MTVIVMSDTERGNEGDAKEESGMILQEKRLDQVKARAKVFLYILLGGSKAARLGRPI